MQAFLDDLPQKVSHLRDNQDLPVTVVIGNESCDLDSAVCSLVYAHFWNATTFSLPVLNIPRMDISLKTEVNYCIGQDNLRKIPCRDDLELGGLGNLKLILVDHHVLSPLDASLVPSVVEIIDHREVTNNSAIAAYKDARKIKIALVGSCATLVSEELLSNGYKVSSLVGNLTASLCATFTRKSNLRTALDSAF